MEAGKKPSIFEDRAAYGSDEELDEYGVWIKSEPRDIEPEASLSEKSLEDSSSNDFDIDLMIGGANGIDDSDLNDENAQSSSQDTSKSKTTEINVSAEKSENELLLRIVNELSTIKSELSSLKDEINLIRNEDKVPAETKSTQSALENFEPIADEPQTFSDDSQDAEIAGVITTDDVLNGSPEDDDSAVVQDDFSFETDFNLEDTETPEIDITESEPEANLSDDLEPEDDAGLENTQPENNDEEAETAGGFFGGESGEDDETIALSDTELDSIFDTADVEDSPAEDSSPDIFDAEIPEEIETAPEEDASLEDIDLTGIEDNPEIESIEPTEYSTTETVGEENPFAIEFPDDGVETESIPTLENEETEIAQGTGALSGDELLNIFNTADIVEEPADETLIAENGEEVESLVDDTGAAFTPEISLEEPANDDAEDKLDLDIDLEGEVAGETQDSDEEDIVIPEDAGALDDSDGLELAAEQEDSVEEFTDDGSLESFDIETPVEDLLSDDSPIEDTPIEDVPFEDTPIEDTPIKDTQIEDSPAPSNTGGDTISGKQKEDIKAVLSYLDTLLESLPESKIEEFAQSENFIKYKNIFKELGLTGD